MKRKQTHCHFCLLTKETSALFFIPTVAVSFAIDCPSHVILARHAELGKKYHAQMARNTPSEGVPKLIC